MGTGKSVVGQALAARLGRPFVDVDEAIEREQGRPIRKIFAEDGEAAFRRAEQAMIQRVTRRDGQVIAAGGGAVMEASNLAALTRAGWLVWLKAEPDIILQRVGETSRRPLLDAPDPKGRVEELLARRQATYAKADAVVDTTRRTVEQVVDEILRVTPQGAAPCG
ncbi:MAG: shikimate kinase [Candidatus Omnitrophica bacterium]|nr:shikimate kinase [Candidatus Omnitrophota bacterium]